MKVSIHKKRTPILIAFFLLLLQQVLLNITTGFVNSAISGLDELITILGIFTLFACAVQKKLRLDKIDLRMLWFYSGFTLLSFLSNVRTPLQSVFDNLTDFIVCSRFIVFYLITRCLIKKVNNRKLIKEISKGCKFLTWVTLGLAIHDTLMTPFFVKSDTRFGISSLQLFYPHPSYMAVACFSCAIVFGMMLALEKNRAYFHYFAINCILMLLTLRTKAIASAICIFFLWYAIVKLNVQFKKLMLGIAGVFALVFGKSQINFYYGKQVVGGTRALMTRDSVRLANRYFPLGSGFGTFGSNIAAKHYSPLYVELGYLSIENGKENAYLSDVFWPIVIAQSGWMGLINFIGVLTCLFQKCFDMEKKNRYFYWLMLSILIYELISSTSEPAFFNPSTAVLFVLFGMMINIVEEIKLN